MQAYDQQMSGASSGSGVLLATKGGPGGQVVKVKKNGYNREQQTTTNPFLFATAIAEFFFLLGVIAMNVLFRFVASTRDGASMVDYSELILSISDVIPARPYYDYRESFAYNKGSGVGIQFGMPEYAFQVPVFILPLLLITVVELVRHLYPRRQVKMVETVGIVLPMAARRTVRFYYVYLLFGAMAGVLASILKLLLPVARPHYIVVCGTAAGMSVQNILTANYAKFLDVSANCVVDVGDPLSSDVMEALRSFPSYHATIAVFSATYLCLYVHYSLRLRGQYSTALATSFPIVVMGAIGALHRLVTHHASWWDVAWGGLLGLAMAFYAVYGTLNRFRERSWTIVPTTSNNLPQFAHETSSTSPPISMGTVNYGYSPPENTYNHRQQGYSSQQPQQHAGPHQVIGLPRVLQTGQGTAPVKQTYHSERPAPTQAFNSTFVHDKPQQEYNRPRQRFSMPGPPRESPSQRPASAYPQERHRNPSRYEGTSYL